MGKRLPIATIALVAAQIIGPIPAHASEQILLPGCGAGSSETEHQIDSELILAEAWLPDPGAERDSVIYEAVELQLLHVNGYFRNDERLIRDGWRSMSARRDQIEILSSESVPYGQRYTLDRFRVTPDVLAHSYLSSALRAKRTRPDQPGHKVKYRARVRILRCMKPTTRAALPQWIPLPKDPFLAIWSAGASDRKKPRSVYSRGFVSPCAIEEMANTGDALSFWRLWNPNGAGCSALLDRSRSLVSAATQALEKTPPLSQEQDLLAFLDPSRLIGRPGEQAIRVGVHFGKRPTEAYRRFAFRTLASQASWLADDRRTSRHAIWNRPAGGPADEDPPQARQFIVFLRSLPTALTVRQARVVEVTGKQVSLELTGTLLRSKRWLKLTVQYGSIPEPAFLTSLKRDHVVYFDGETTAGVEVALRDASAPEFRAKPSQILALLNSHSYSLLGETLRRARAGLSTDFLLATSPGGAELGASYALALMRALDQNGLSIPSDLKQALEGALPREEFFAYRRIR